MLVDISGTNLGLLTFLRTFDNRMAGRDLRAQIDHGVWPSLDLQRSDITGPNLAPEMLT